MTYTAVFRDDRGKYIFEFHVATHDRPATWKAIGESRNNKESCLVLLIDGQANINTYSDIVDMAD
jgi:hypothetical protein